MELVQCAATLVHVSRFCERRPPACFQAAFLAKRRLRAILPITPNPVSNIASVPGSALAAAWTASCADPVTVFRPLPTTLPSTILFRVPSMSLIVISSRGSDPIVWSLLTLLATVCNDDRVDCSACALAPPEWPVAAKEADAAEYNSKDKAVNVWNFMVSPSCVDKQKYWWDATTRVFPSR